MPTYFAISAPANSSQRFPPMTPLCQAGATACESWSWASPIPPLDLRRLSAAGALKDRDLKSHGFNRWKRRHPHPSGHQPRPPLFRQSRQGVALGFSGPRGWRAGPLAGTPVTRSGATLPLPSRHDAVASASRSPGSRRDPSVGKAGTGSRLAPSRRSNEPRPPCRTNRKPTACEGASPGSGLPRGTPVVHDWEVDAIAVDGACRADVLRM